MSDNEASIGLRVYLEDAFSTGLGDLSSSLTDLSTLVTEVGNTMTSGFEEGLKGLDDLVIGLDDVIQVLGDLGISVSPVAEEFNNLAATAQQASIETTGAVEEIGTALQSTAETAPEVATLNDTLEQTAPVSTQAAEATAQLSSEGQILGGFIQNLIGNLKDQADATQAVTDATVAANEAIDQNIQVTTLASDSALKFTESVNETIASLKLADSEVAAIDDTWQQFFETLAGTEASATEINTLEQAVNRWFVDLKNGDTDVTTFIANVQNATNAMRDLAKATESTVDPTDKVAQAISDQLGNALQSVQDAMIAFGQLSVKEMDQVDASLNALMQQFQDGNLTLDEFKTTCQETAQILLDEKAAIDAAAAAVAAEKQALVDQAQAARDAATAQQALADQEKAASDAAQNANGSHMQLYATLMLLGQAQQYLTQANQAVDKTLQDTVTQAGNLQDAFTRLEIATGQAGAPLDTLKQKILDLASNSEYSAVDISNAFSLLAERGKSAGDISNYLSTAVINLAEVTNSDVLPSSDLLVTAMNAYGASASQAGQYADMLTYSFQHGLPDVQGMQSALTNVGGTAASLGVPFDQLMAALTYLTNNGMPNASQAATSLRYIFTTLSNPTTTAAEEFHNLGLISTQSSDQLNQMMTVLNSSSKTQYSWDGTLKGLNQIYTAAMKLNLVHSDQTFTQWATSIGAMSSNLYDKTGKLKDLPAIFQQIGDAIRKLPADQQAQAIGGMFNVRSGQGGRLILDDPTIQQDMQKGAQGQDNSTKGKGLAQGSADKIMQDYNQSFAAMKTSWNSFLGIMGQDVLPILTPLFNHINDIIKALSGDGAKNARTFILAFLGFSAVILPIGLAAIGIATLSAMLGLLGLSLGAVMAPMLPFIAIAVGIAIVASLIIAYWGPISKFFTGLWNGIVGAAKGAWAGISGGVSAAWGAVSSAVSNAFHAVVGAIAKFAGPIGDAIHKAFGVVGDVLHKVFDPIGKMLEKTFGEAFKPLVQAMGPAGKAFQDLGKQLHPIVDLLQGAFKGALLAVSMVVNGAVVTPFKAFMSVIGAIGDKLHPLGAALQVLGANIGKVGGPAKDFAALLGGLLLQGLKNIWQFVVDLGKALWVVLGAALGFIIGIVMGVVRAFGAFAAGVVTAVTGAIQFFNGLVTFFKGILEAVLGLVTGNTKMMQDGWQKMVTGVQGMLTGLGNWLKGLFQMVFGTISAFLHGFVDGFLGTIANFAGMISSRVGGMMDNFKNAIINGGHNVTQWFRDLPGTISGILGGLGNTLLNAGANLMTMLGNGISGAIGKVTGPIGNVVSFISGHLGFSSPTKDGPLSQSGNYMPNMMKMLGKGIVDNRHHITGAIGTVANDIHSGLTSPSIARMQASSSSALRAGSTTINLQMDGKQVSQVVMDNITGQLQMNGLGRAWR